jgi:hypothetical protein
MRRAGSRLYGTQNFTPEMIDGVERDQTKKRIAIFTVSLLLQHLEPQRRAGMGAYSGSRCADKPHVFWRGGAPRQDREANPCHARAGVINKWPEWGTIDPKRKLRRPIGSNRTTSPTGCATLGLESSMEARHNNNWR